MESAGPFTRELWQTAEPVCQQILQCSYVQGLKDGTLPRGWFAHYLSQDALYLIEDSRALAATASRSINPDELYFLLQLAKDGLDIERALQDDFIRKYALPVAHTQSPAFKAYTTFLLDRAFNAPYPVALAALLPCFWVYYEVGVYICKHAVADNPYQPWIDTYSGTAYLEYTQQFIQITEKIGKGASAEIKRQMTDAFLEGTHHELSVFEEATLY